LADRRFSAPNDNNNPYGYRAAQTLVQVLKPRGGDLTRENVMRQAANLRDLELPMLLRGIKDVVLESPSVELRACGDEWPLLRNMLLTLGLQEISSLTRA
jgi:hypothetical protein